MGTNAKILLAVLVLAVAGSAVYFYVARGRDEAAQQALEMEKARWEAEKEGLEQRIDTLQDEIALQKEGIVSEERLQEVFGQDAGPVAAGSEKRSCEEMQREIRDFFSYLDQQPYVREAHLEKGAAGRYEQIVNALSRNPPLVLEEMKDHYSLVRNVAHFYRVLGKENLFLIRKVLAEESEVVEPVGALFYDRIAAADRCEGDAPCGPPPKVAYEYAAFFLNTLAGKSYLLRRDSRVRILTTYYAILTLDQANRETRNRYGIDIRPFIDHAIQDIRSQQGLIFKKRYLDTLEALKTEYAGKG